ncbi:MAG: ATP-binding protein [Magnetococcales bacterium]|nr:ATP-binding protein [Magnetococcales bacterium]
MLIELSVTNFLSFCETQILSLSAHSGYDELPGNHFSSEIPRGPDLLRSLVIYGANASGKSNLIRAAKFIQDFVINSAKGQEGDPIPVQPFRLNSRSGLAPSIFEMSFIEEGVRYQYGFAATPERVLHEWLLAYPKGRAQRWFERYYNPRDGREEWHLHRNYLPAARTMWRDATRSNALFLSTAVQLNSPQLKPIFDWFAKRLFVLPPHAEISADFSNHLVKSEEGRAKILQFLNMADLNIEEIHVTSRTAEEMGAGDDDPEYLKTLHALLKQKLGDWEWEIMDVLLERRVSDTGEIVRLPWSSESQGTLKLYALAGPWLDMMAHDRILFIDEMETGLHHNLVRFLFDLIHASPNNSRSQLVGATHDTALLESDAFRRDQFWMADRSPERCTRLHPLTDYKVGRGADKQKHYLEGRYGAVPKLRRLGN